MIRFNEGPEYKDRCQGCAYPDLADKKRELLVIGNRDGEVFMCDECYRDLIASERLAMRWAKEATTDKETICIDVTVTKGADTARVAISMHADADIRDDKWHRQLVYQVFKALEYIKRSPEQRAQIDAAAQPHRFAGSPL